MTRAVFFQGLLGVMLCLAATRAARATSVIPPTFPELVAEAEAIVRGRVTEIAVRRSSAPDGTPVIKTHVTFAVERTLKGPERASVTLELLGGTIGDESLVVTGLPRFELGSTDYLFVERNGVQFCPLVAVRHGRYRLLREAGGREFVARDNAVPLTDVTQVVLPLAALPDVLRSASVAGALTPSAFEAAVIAELARTIPAARVR
ncbi:MAG: hypothetical protein ACKODK_20935 [Opitutaceae bacterium]